MDKQNTLLLSSLPDCYILRAFQTGRPNAIVIAHNAKVKRDEIWVELLKLFKEYNLK